jgi:hypothetical protein
MQNDITTPVAIDLTTTSTGRQLNVPEGIKITQISAHFAADLPVERWLAFGRFLSHAAEAVVYWRADWLHFGNQRYGPQRVGDAVAQLELDLGQLKQAEVLNRLSERHAGLSKEHHFILARSRLDPTAQHAWIELSLREHLSARELEESIRAGSVVKLYIDDYRKAGAGGFASIEGILSSWVMLRRQIGDLWREWNAEEIKAFLHYLEPILSFAANLRARLNSLDAHAKEGR